MGSSGRGHNRCTSRPLKCPWWSNNTENQTETRTELNCYRINKNYMNMVIISQHYIYNSLQMSKHQRRFIPGGWRWGPHLWGRGSWGSWGQRWVSGFSAGAGGWIEPRWTPAALESDHQRWDGRLWETCGSVERRDTFKTPRLEKGIILLF